MISFLMNALFSTILSSFSPVFSTISVISSLTYCLRIYQFSHIGSTHKTHISSTHKTFQVCFCYCPGFIVVRRDTHVTVLSFRCANTCWVASLGAYLETIPDVHWDACARRLKEQKCWATLLANLAASSLGTHLLTAWLQSFCHYISSSFSSGL